MLMGAGGGGGKKGGTTRWSRIVVIVVNYASWSLCYSAKAADLVSMVSDVRVESWTHVRTACILVHSPRLELPLHSDNVLLWSTCSFLLLSVQHFISWRKRGRRARGGGGGRGKKNIL